MSSRRASARRVVLARATESRDDIGAVFLEVTKHRRQAERSTFERRSALLRMGLLILWRKRLAAVDDFKSFWQVE
jgi:hypothetical protein